MKSNRLMGMIDIIIGPMFAGKTTELIRRIRRYEVANKSCLLVKYDRDLRYGTDLISTHDNQGLKAISTETLSEIDDKAKTYDVIGIDEGQFFSDIVEFSENMANDGKIIIISALSGTYRRENFGRIPEIFPLAENITKLTAVCMDCKASASFTTRISSSKETELIGGKEHYKPVCRT